ncbi:MAG: hypothetical protein GEU94_12260 [Micromonosporaceae bacterium]|nr:hypothetical protein [Micromonosporaceae bacterium]
MANKGARARRRAERQVEAAARREAAERREQRRQRLRRLWPRRREGRTGRTFLRRSRSERAGIAGLAMIAVGLVWFLVDELSLRIGLTALILVGLPAFVVLALDRRY